MGDQAILTRLLILTLIAAGVAPAQTPYFAPNLRADAVKSSTPALPVSFEDSTRFYFHVEIAGAAEPWVPQYNRVRLFYDTTEHRMKWLFHWGGTRYADSTGVSAGDSVRAAWKADSAGDVHWNNITARPVLLVPADSALIRANSNFLYQVKGTYLVPADSTLIRAYSDYLYQTKGTYLIPTDSVSFRAYSNTLYEPAGVYLIPADSTKQRTYSNFLYEPAGNYQPAGTYLIPADSTEIRAASAFLYQPKDADLTTFAATNPTANVFSFLAAADYAAMRTLLSLNNVTNESKATMFTSPNFTGTVTIPSPFTLGATSVTATGTEMNYLGGVTSGIQSQLDLKSPLASPTFTGTVTIPTMTVTGNATIAGYLRVGSNSAPTNTTAGDFTASRFSFGNSALTGTQVGVITGTLTETSAGTKYGINTQFTLNPASASSSDFRAINFEASTAGANNFANVQAGYFIHRMGGSGNITVAIGGYFSGFFGSTSTSFGTVTDVFAGRFQAVTHFTNNPTGTITTATGVQVQNSTRGGAGITLTNLRGIDIAVQTLGTNNTNLLIGTGTTGNWSIYNNSTYSNYINGNVGIGISPLTKLHSYGADNTTVQTVEIAATQANVTATDIFMDFRSSNGSEATIAGTAVAGVIAYNTFTGAHYTQFSNEAEAIVQGMILSATGSFMPGGDHLPTVTRSAGRNDKGVYGVYAGKIADAFSQREIDSLRRMKRTYDSVRVIHDSVNARIDNGDSTLTPITLPDYPSFRGKTLDYAKGNPRKDLHQVFALGTGIILVTESGGNIAVGDFIASSPTRGLGEKQADDLEHSYTVAKATEAVDWSTVAIHPQLGVKVKRIACTYTF